MVDPNMVCIVEYAPDGTREEWNPEDAFDCLYNLEDRIIEAARTGDVNFKITITVERKSDAAEPTPPILRNSGGDEPIVRIDSPLPHS